MTTLEYLFYLNINGKQVKTILPNLIYYLDDVAFAY